MNELMLHLGPWFIILLAMALFLLPQMARILREYERGVIFRWGKLKGARGPGLSGRHLRPAAQAWVLRFSDKAPSGCT